MQDLDHIIAEALNQHIFDKIWNEPLSEYRENIHPLLLTARSQTGSVTLLSGTIPLPTSTTPYFIYGMSDSDICASLSFPENEWISTDKLCNEHRILIHMYSFRGNMFHKGQVYFRYSNDRKVMYIAVAKPMMTKMISVGEVTDVYLTVYFDSDIPNEIKVSSFHVPEYDPSNTVVNAINAAYRNISDMKQASLYVNGYEISGNEYKPKIGDDIDIIEDRNVVATFDVDLTDAKQLCYYYSDKDKCYKYVIHIPKALNPDNKVFTHNTCDMIVRTKTADQSGMTRGVYLHRCAKLTVGQITHNDFSIPQYIVDAFRDQLKTQDVTIRVQVRQHDKDNYLIRDKSYIDLLYTHEDADILYFLRGNVKYQQLSFWTAAALEQSVYVGMMFDVPEDVTPDKIGYYVEGLGYYHVLSLICERVITSVITDAFGGSVVYTKPYLYRGYQILPMLYLNGKKINNRYIEVSGETADTIAVTLKPEVYYKVGDILTLIMYLDANDDILSILPTESERSFTLPTNDFTIYEKIDTFVPSKYQGVDQQSSVRYKDVTTDIGLYELAYINNAWTLFCGDAMENRRYILLQNVCSYRWDVNVDALVYTGENLVIDLSRHLKGSQQTMPILNFKNESIYLNGRYLVRGLDYVINKITSIEGDVSFIQLVIQSFEYLRDTNNNVEIFLNVAEIEDLSSGFVIEDKVYDMTPANLWFPSISVCHIYGNLENEAINRGIYIQLPEGKHSNGEPFEVQTAIPLIVKQFIDKYHTNDDKARLEILNDYFYGKSPAGTGIIRISGSHRVYSTFMNRVIRDIVFHDRQFANDPDADRLKDQLYDYNYLKPLDLVMFTPLDMNLVDTYPAYQQYTTDVDKRIIIKKLIEAYMPSDKISAGGDFYE